MIIICPFVLAVLPHFTLSTMPPFVITQILDNSPKDRDAQMWASPSCATSLQAEPVSMQQDFKLFWHISCVSFVLFCFFFYTLSFFIFCYGVALFSIIQISEERLNKKKITIIPESGGSFSPSNTLFPNNRKSAKEGAL